MSPHPGPMPFPKAALAALLVASLALAGCTDVVDDVTGRASNDWAHAMTGAAALRDQGLTGAGVKVAVVDTGLAHDHPEFAGLTLGWSDVINGRPEPYDDDGHGTHVAGLVVAQENGGNLDPQVLGIAPGAQILAVKGVPGGGEGTGGDVARAIDRAVDMGAHVLVLSLGGGTGLPILGQQVERSVERAIDKGVVVVAAAGNAGEDASGSSCTVTSPGSVPRVIAVGAVDSDRRIAEFSCAGENEGGPVGLGAPEDPNKKPELVAPGVALIGPWPGTNCAGRGSEYCVLSGTSQATPIVGGIVALLLEAKPELKRRDAATVERIKEALVSSAEPLAGQDTPHDDRYGYGLVRGDRALDAL